MGMNTNPSLGTGFAGVLAHAVAAGIIASSRGSARAACAPFRNVRWGIAFFVINITLSFLSSNCGGVLCPPAIYQLARSWAVIDRHYSSIYSLQMLRSFERSAFEMERSSRF